MDNAGRIANKRLLLYIQWFEDGGKSKGKKMCTLQRDIVFRTFLKQ